MAAAFRKAGSRADRTRAERALRAAVFADIFGVSKNVSIPIDELETALDGRVTFDGGSIDGFVRGEELDMLLRARSLDVRDLSLAGGRRRRARHG